MARSRKRSAVAPVTLAVILQAVAQSRGETSLDPIYGLLAGNISLREAAEQFASRHWPDGPRPIEENSWVYLSYPDALFTVDQGTQVYGITRVNCKFPEPDRYVVYRLGPIEAFIEPGAGEGPAGEVCGRLVWSPAATALARESR